MINYKIIFQLLCTEKHVKKQIFYYLPEMLIDNNVVKHNKNKHADDIFG